MKKFLIVLFVVAFAATGASAVDFQTSGMYYARGSWISNPNGLNTGNADDPVVDYGYYDHELDMTTRIVVDDNTKIIVRYEIHDETWISRGGNQAPGGGLDDNIEFIRTWGGYTWTSTGTTLDLGLMTGGAWAYSWADTGTGTYRVKVTQATPIGPVIGILEKNTEIGSENSGVDDAEKDDHDAYYLALVGKAGPVNIKPLFGYLYNSAADLNQNNDGWQRFLFDLGIDGAYDGWGFEAEFQYNNWSYDEVLATPDADTWGIYLKGWFQAGAANIYAQYAYGNEDEGTVFSFGDDYEPQILFGNQFQFGPVADMVSAAHYFVIGVDYAATDALSFSGNFGYVKSTVDEDIPLWDGADGWELDVGFAYKVTDAIVYSAMFGYADISLDETGEALNGGDPDGAWRLYHRFQINF